jgi:hypothetical protein
MVTMHTWQALSSFQRMRVSLLENNSISILANLARYAFDEADPPGFVTLLVAQAFKPCQEQRISGFRQTQPRERKEHKGKQALILIPLRSLRSLRLKMILPAVLKPESITAKSAKNTKGSKL